MKNGKAVASDHIPVEAWKCLEYLAVNLLINTFNEISDGKNVPEEERKSTSIPILKDKVIDIQLCKVTEIMDGK